MYDDLRPQKAIVTHLITIVTNAQRVRPSQAEPCIQTVLSRTVREA